MNFSLTSHSLGYSIRLSDMAVMALTGFSGIPYAKRHWNLLDQSRHPCGQLALAILEALPLLGGFVALIERIVIAVHKHFNNNTPLPASSRIPETLDKSVKVKPPMATPQRPSPIPSPIPSPALYACATLPVAAPQRAALTLDVFATLSEENRWLCLRGLPEDARIKAGPYAGKTALDFELDRIKEPGGFACRSVSPAGYLLPFYQTGFIVSVAERDIALCQRKKTGEITPFLGTNQYTGFGDRKFSVERDEHEKEQCVVEESGDPSSNLLFRTFDEFKRHKDEIYNYSPSQPLRAWTDRSIGGDEFVTTICPERIIGIFYSITHPRSELTPNQAESSKRIQIAYQRVFGTQLPIYHYVGSKFIQD